MKYFLLITLLFIAVCFSQAQTFAEDAATAGVNLGGSKEGGAVWADFDNDGDRTWPLIPVLVMGSLIYIKTMEVGLLQMSLRPISKI